MSIIYIDPIDEESAWHILICGVRNLPGSAFDMSLNVVDISKIKYITRGGIKEKQYK